MMLKMDILPNRNELTEFTFFRGRVALYAILRGLNIGPGDDVATQAFTCLAVPEAIMATGAKPIYIDLEADSFNMDATDLESKITSQTRAIILQHTYGIPAAMTSLLHVASKRDLPIIEDCCHTLASTYRGQLVGSFGVASFYSFEWGKPIVAGIGGSALINDPQLLHKIRQQYPEYQFAKSSHQFKLRLQYLAHRLLFRPSLYWPVRSLYRTLGSVGAAESNYNPIDANGKAEDFSLRMSPPLQKRLQQNLEYLDRQTQHSQWVSNQYQTGINTSVVSHPRLPQNSHSVFARYPLITSQKSALLAKARQSNVELAEWYSTPVHPITAKDWSRIHYEPASCPHAEKRCQQVVTLPTHPAVHQRDIDRAVNFFNEVSL